MTFLAGLVSIVGSVTARVLIALGFSVVTITGVVVSVQAVKDLVMQNLSSGSAAILQLAGLGGAWEALGILFGVASFATAYYTATQATKVIGGGV